VVEAGVTEDKEKVGIGLLDVMYAVVLTYGFERIDSVKGWINFLLFLFTVTIIALDWFHAHYEYLDRKKKRKYYAVFFLDLVILFVFSRLIYTSITGLTEFWLWMFCLFLFYALWDLVWLKLMEKDDEWWHSFLVDLLCFVGYVVFYYFIANQVIKCSDWLILIGCVPYAFAYWIWPKGKYPK